MLLELPASVQCRPSVLYHGDRRSSLLSEHPYLRKEAAILVLLRWSRELSDWEVLLTLRSEAVSSHQGEVAFPGGMRDASDASPAATALREAMEEVGLPPAFVRVLGTVFPFVTRHAILVFPVFAVLHTADHFRPLNNAEVDLSFWLPLSRFLSDRGRSEQSIKVAGKVFSTNFFLDELGEERSVVTFGITSFIAIAAAALVYRRKPDFVWPIGNSKFHSMSYLELVGSVKEEMNAFLAVAAASHLSKL